MSEKTIAEQILEAEKELKDSLEVLRLTAQQHGINQPFFYQFTDMALSGCDKALAIATEIMANPDAMFKYKPGYLETVLTCTKDLTKASVNLIETLKDEMPFNNIGPVLKN